jgi:hypothetical protein
MPNPQLAANFGTNAGAPTAANWNSNNPDAFVYDTTNHNLYYSSDGTAAHAIEVAHIATGVPPTTAQVAAAVHIY